MKMHKKIRSQRFARYRGRRGSQRRRGVVAVYVACAMLFIMGAAAISFDLSYLYNRRAEAQKAADAAALAGSVGGDAEAKRYAAANGYGPLNKATVSIDTSEGLYRVSVSRPEPLYFAKYFLPGGVSNVGATAAAEHQDDLPVPIQNYGIGAKALVNLSVFGADAYHFNGDPYSPRYLTINDVPQFKDGKPVDNPLYDGKGYDFLVRLGMTIDEYKAKKNTNFLNVELFDPGTSNKGGAQSPSVGNSIDEIRPGWGNVTTQTVTKYTLTYTDGDGGTEQSMVKTFGADTTDTDMKWDPSFQIDLIKHPNPTNIKLNVTTTSGTSENGFQIRVGPPSDPKMSDEDWVAANKDVATVSADGRMPINFNTNTEITLNLGHVPPISNNPKVMIDKFDLDVGSSSLTYVETRDGTGQVYNYTGKLGDSTGRKGDVWSKDTIEAPQLPANYPGGTWQAKYTAGLQDTSVWHLSYTGNGSLRLVR